MLTSSKTVQNAAKVDVDDRLFGMSDVIDEVQVHAVARHLMFMYENIVGPLSGTVVDKLNESETLSEKEVTDLKHDLAPLLAIVRNEDTDNFIEEKSFQQRSPGTRPVATTSKGIQCAPSTDDLLQQLKT